MCNNIPNPSKMNSFRNGPGYLRTFPTEFLVRNDGKPLVTKNLYKSIILRMPFLQAIFLTGENMCDFIDSFFTFTNAFIHSVIFIFHVVQTCLTLLLNSSSLSLILNSHQTID